MRVVILGGTQFIGRRIAEDLAGRGDDVTVVHRGVTEPAELAGLRHVHADRASFADVAGQVSALRPDAIIDSNVGTAADVAAVLPHLPDARLLALSSVDVYQAFALVNSGGESVGLPISEESPVRSAKYPFRGQMSDAEYYDKLDVEPAYTDRGGTVLRLSMIYGENDGQRREEFVLRRVRAGRTAIPVGACDWLWTRCYAGDVAEAVALALGSDAAQGQVFNVGERLTRSVSGWMSQILAAAGHHAELVRVPEAVLPDDLWITRSRDQHMLLDSGKIMRTLGWQPSPAEQAIGRSVSWHLAHPPEPGEAGPSDFSADDKALASA